MKKIFRKLVLFCIVLSLIFCVTACVFTQSKPAGTDLGTNDTNRTIDTDNGVNGADQNMDTCTENESNFDIIEHDYTNIDNDSITDSKNINNNVDNTEVENESNRNSDNKNKDIDRQGVLNSDILFGSTKSYEEYLDFTFEKPDDIVFDYSNIEYEALFAKILSGEEDYRDHFDWFASNPQYIFRHNKACLDLVKTVIEDGKLTKENKELFGGLLVATGGQPAWQIFAQCIPINGVSYCVVFGDDWTVKYFKKTIIMNVNDFSAPEYLFDGEIRQIDYTFQPIMNNEIVTDYYLSQSYLYIVVDMGSGETADCSVLAVYENKIETGVWWTGKDDATINYFSYVRITADDNNVFSKGLGGMFNEIYLFSEIDGTWDLAKAWETYRGLSLTANQTIDSVARPELYFLQE